MWKKSASLESLHLQSGGASVFGDGHEVAASSERDALRSAYVRANSVRVSRNRGCNESFRAAVDRSYEQALQCQLAYGDTDSRGYRAERADISK